MESARRLLLVAALVLAITADARTDAAESTLTLSPDAGSLISTRDDSTTTGSSSSTTVIGSAALDTTKETEVPAASTESAATSASDSDDAPSSAFATVSPGWPSDPSTPDTASQTDAAITAAASSSSSKSSAASVDTLNNSDGELNTGNSSSMGTILPAVFGALACVGAIVMAVTYKKRRDSNSEHNASNRPSSDCEYTGGADFTPDNRALSAVQEDDVPIAIKVLGTQSSADMTAPPAIADFTGTNSSATSSSPFGSTRCKARVSSPVPSFYSSSETNTEFQNTCQRHEGGSNVVLTFNEVPTDSSKRAAPQVQL